MTHKDIFEFFKTNFPVVAAKATEWFPNGPVSIRVKGSYGYSEIIFSYMGPNFWRLESVKKRKEKS